MTFIYILLIIIAVLLIAIIVYSFYSRKQLILQKEKDRLILKALMATALLFIKKDIKDDIKINISQSIAHMRHDSQLLSTGIGNVSQNSSIISNNVSAMAAVATEQKLLAKKNTDSLKRLLFIIAGTQTKGLAGLKIVDNIFSNIPLLWQVRNFQVNGKPVLFGIKLPNDTIVPIDSKWSSTGLMLKFIVLLNVDARKKIKSLILLSLFKKAKLVSKYIDANITASYGLMVVPDTIYNISSGVALKCFLIKVIMVSYSLFLPYLLLMYQMTAISNSTIDMTKLNSHLLTISDGLNAVQLELDGRLSRTITMLNNTRDLIRGNVNKSKNSLSSITK